MLLSRDQILTAADGQSERVMVPEWGGEVIVRALTGAERDAFEAALTERRGRRVEVRLENVRARLVAMCAIDEQGGALFYPSDVELLGQKSAAALQRVFEVCQRLSGLTDQDVEELAKN